jgi:hypothetical protein
LKFFLHLLIIDFASEAYSKSCALSFFEDLDDLSEGKFFLLGKDTSVVHLLFKDVLRDNNLLAITSSFNLVSLNFLDLEVAGPREPVANRKVLYVPESTVSALLLLLFSFLLAALLEDILNVLEDDVLYGPVVNLAELVV